MAKSNAKKNVVEPIEEIDNIELEDTTEATEAEETLVKIEDLTTEQLLNGWNPKHPHCSQCETTERKNYSGGTCTRCYTIERNKKKGLGQYDPAKRERKLERVEVKISKLEAELAALKEQRDELHTLPAVDSE